MEWGNIYYIYIQTKKSNEIKTNSQRQLIYIQPKKKHKFTETTHIHPNRNTISQRQHTSNQNEHKFTERTHIQPTGTQIHRDNRNPTKIFNEHKFTETTHVQPTGTQIHSDSTHPAKQEWGESMVPDPDGTGGMKGGLHFERFRNNLRVLGPCPVNTSR